MNIIPKLTKNCKRNDCSIVSLGGTTTLMGWSPTYDKHGNATGTDPNSKTSNYHCHTCGKRWTIFSGGLRNEDEIRETP